MTDKIFTLALIAFKHLQQNLASEIWFPLIK